MKKNPAVLDVGCGHTPIGDVNCDLFLEDVDSHRTISHSEHTFRINVKKTPNFIICDSRYLPFKDESFDIVVSRQVIEHVPKPELMASEMVRVSRDLIVIETVHRRGERLMPHKMREWLKKHHINKFDFTNFGVLAKKLGVKTIVSEIMDYNYFVHFGYFKLFKAPFGIRVVWSKTCGDWSFYNKRIEPKAQYLSSLGLRAR